MGTLNKFHKNQSCCSKVETLVAEREWCRLSTALKVRCFADFYPLEEESEIEVELSHSAYGNISVTVVLDCYGDLLSIEYSQGFLKNLLSTREIKVNNSRLLEVSVGKKSFQVGLWVAWDQFPRDCPDSFMRLDIYA